MRKKRPGSANANVRFGSGAVIQPQSAQCPLRANSGHSWNTQCQLVRQNGRKAFLCPAKVFRGYPEGEGILPVSITNQTWPVSNLHLGNEIGHSIIFRLKHQRLAVG
jgi:hypothetical protein